jgi:hydroxymethylpyrimidine/phosphomethylpyrimidine kinase
VRSPVKMGDYQLVIPPSELVSPNLNEFYTLVQQSVIQKTDNSQDLLSYFNKYHYKTIVKK